MIDDGIEPAGASFDLERIGRECQVAGLFSKPQVNSTNDWAIELARTPGIPSPVLLLTEHQIAGRGRGANSWQATRGSLALTLLWRCDWPVNDPRRNALPLAVGQGVCEALDGLGFRAAIKWPNDIFLNDRKLGGILIESVGGSPWLAVGCGLNINNEIGELPTAISLQQVAAGSCCMTSVTISVVNSVLNTMGQLESGIERIVDYCQKHDWLAGKRVVWIQADRRCEATVRGISADGGLGLRIGERDQVIYTGSIRTLEE